MRFATSSQLKASSWYVFNDEPIKESPWYKKELGGPAVILPKDSPDGYWHLFAHTWLGIEHFISASGLEWKRGHSVIHRGRFPSIYKEGNTYYLLYETHDSDLFWKAKRKDTSGISRIMITSSTDLTIFSKPRQIVDGRNVETANDYSKKPRLSRPQLFMWQGRYRLYFGSSHTTIYDTKQKATSYLCYAESDNIFGEYKIVQKPILKGDADSKYTNLALGSVNIIPLSDGFGAVNCSYYYEEDKKRSRTIMTLFESEDGLVFKKVRTLQETPEKGWASRHITGCCSVFKEDENTWYCYYSANAKAKIFKLIPYVKESLGLYLGKVREN